MPVAKTRMPPPSGSKASTSARFSSAPQAAPSGCLAQKRRVPLRRRVGHFVGDVGGRADRDEHRLAVGGKGEVARPMAVAGRQRRRDDFGRPGRVGRRCGRGSARPRRSRRHRRNAGLGLADRRRRRTGDAARRRRWRSRRLGRAVCGAEYGDAAGDALGDEDVAIRRDAHDARLVEAGSEQADGETCRRLRPGALGTGDAPRGVGGRAATLRRRQVGRRQLAAHARRIAAPVAESRGAGSRPRVVGKRQQRRTGDQQAGEDERRSHADGSLTARREAGATELPCARLGGGFNRRTAMIARF